MKNPYSVPCPVCSSGVGDACFMRRPPWDVCMYPHRERVRVAAWQNHVEAVAFNATMHELRRPIPSPSR